MSSRVTRRGLLATLSVLSSGALIASCLSRPAVAQTDTISIDRTLGDDVFLSPTSAATVTGTATLEPGAELEVRLSGSGDSPFLLSNTAIVGDDGTWATGFNLGDFTEGTEFTIVVYYQNDPLTRAPGVIRALRAQLQFNDQTVDANNAVVRVESVRLEAGGFVPIHEDTLSGPLIGVSQLLEAGQAYSSLEIPLERAITEQTTLVAAAHLDTNRNQTFDPTEDHPYEAEGDPVLDTATVQPPTPTVTTTTTTTEPTPTTTNGNGPGVPVDIAVGGGGGILGTMLLRHARNRFDNNHPPEADIWYAPDAPDPGRPIVFDGRRSIDPDPHDMIVQYQWTIDGSTKLAPRFVHSFPKAGDYEVTLTVTDGHQNSDTHTETIAVESRGGAFELARVHPDASGDDHANLTQEYLVFENTCDESLELDGWTIHDAAEEEGRVREGEHTFTFPEEFALAPGATVTVHTGVAIDEDDRSEETREDRHCYWGQSRAVWNNDEDIVVVADEQGQPVLATRYTRTEEGSYDCEELDVEVLSEWFPTVVVSRRENASLVDVRVEKGFVRSWVLGLAGFLAGAVLFRGPFEWFWSWSVITGFCVSFSATWAAFTGLGFVAPSLHPLVLLGVSVLATGMMLLSGLVWGVWTMGRNVWGWMT